MKAASDALALGFSVFPVPDKWEEPYSSKPCSYSWKKWQSKLMPPVSVKREFEGVDKMAIVCGAISGNLLVLDFDNSGELYPDWLELVRDNLGFDPGAVASTIKGGKHVYLRCGGSVPGNEKLAMSEDGAVLIETRGEGGIVYAAPTPGYTWETGSLESVPAVTAEDLDGLLQIAKALDRSPEAPEKPSPKGEEAKQQRAGDAFDAGSSWDEVLSASGARKLGTKKGLTYWCRPGKKKGISATTGIRENGHDRLKVFTSNWPPFDVDGSYSKFGAYALLSHGGDFAKAAKAAAARFGIPAPAAQREAERFAGPPELSVVDGGAATETKPDRAKKPDRHACTDLGNAHRLVESMGGNYRWCHSVKDWFVYDGRRYRQMESGDAPAVQLFQNSVLRSLFGSSGDRKKELREWGMRCEGRSRIESAVALAKSDPRVSVRMDEFDDDPDWLNCESGTIDLVTGKILPHSPERLTTKLSPVAYDPALLGKEESSPPVFTELVAGAFPGDPETAGFLVRFLGYCLTGHTYERSLCFMYGKSGCGKSTIGEALYDILGDYAGIVPTDVLMASKGGFRPDPTAIASLQGKRLALADETDAGSWLNEALIKGLTGNKVVKAKLLYQNQFDMPVTFKIVMTGNHRPNVRNFDDAVRDRIRIVPFGNPLPEEERDKHLKKKLTAESQLILTLLVEAQLEWRRTGLAPSGQMELALASYEEESDRVQMFIDDVCETKEGSSDSVQNLYENYKLWCKTNGYIGVETARRFGDDLAVKGYARHKGGKGVRLHLGISAPQVDPPPAYRYEGAAPWAK